MPEESSSFEIRLIREELVRERVWSASEEAVALRVLAEKLFELADAAEAWAARAAERWISSGEHNVSGRTLADLVDRVQAMARIVNADLN